MLHAHVDIETASELDLTEVGVDAYARHPSTRILMLSWKVAEGPVNTWTVEDGPPPEELIWFLQDPLFRKFAHNAYFEVTLVTHVWMLDLDIRQWRCTMVWAYMLSLPGALDQLGDVLLLPPSMKKSKDGKRLMNLFSMPQKLTRKNPHRWLSAATRPVEWAQFVEYNRQDVIAESFIAERRLSAYPIPDNQWEDWFIDYRINERGLPIDRPFVDHACRMISVEVAQVRRELQALTGVDNPNSDHQFGPWVRARGYPFGDLQKASVQKILDDELYADIHHPLLLRAQLKLTSVAKYPAVQESMAADDRLRHTYQFSGAQRTGRWAGRGAHFQNPKKAPKELEPYYADIVASARIGDSRYLREMYGSPLKALSAAVRGMIRAPEGYTLFVADLASIESCVIARLARCPAMLQVFEAGLDIYRVFAMLLFHVSYEEVTRQQRNHAKPPVLGCGFRLSGGQMAPDKRTGDMKKTGLWGYAANLGIPLTQEESKYAVEVFRSTYPEVPQLWYDIEEAVFHVIQRGGTRDVGLLNFDCVGPFLRMHLPSGRMLHYLRPKLEQREMPWTGHDGKKVLKWSITFEGVEETDEGRKLWGRQATHGGKLAENGTQAVANDILRAGLACAEEEGFHIVGHSHDEGISLERLHSGLTVEGLCDCLSRPLGWFPGVPLAAAGFETPFYRKD